MNLPDPFDPTLVILAKGIRQANRDGHHRRHWEESFERLDDHLRTLNDEDRSNTMETTMTATRIDRGSTDTMAIYSEGAELVFERTFDAPRDQVWKAFTDSELVPRWWGQHGTTTTVVEMDVRVGGTWRYVNAAPDREDVTFYGEYLEVDPPERIEWTFMFDVEGVGPMGGPETFTFTELDGKTKVTSIGHMGSVEALEGALSTGMVGGAIETWDRLAALLAEG